MGLTISDGIQDFMMEATKVDFGNKKILMLGKQVIYIDYVQFYILAEKLHLDLKSEDISINNYNYDRQSNIDSYCFFKLLGFEEVRSLDISDYENADIIFDLNIPISDSCPWRNYFDYIVDGGTLEHVFNFPIALGNINEMLKINGKIYHYIPASGYINHGYYSLSPLVLKNWYENNDYNINSLSIVLHNSRYDEHCERCDFPDSLEESLATAVDFRMLCSNMDGKFELLHEYRGLLRCIATKTSYEKCSHTPIDRHWYDAGKGLTRIIIKAWCLNDYNDGQIAIWGAGYTGNRFLQMLKDENFPFKKILGIFDSNRIKTNFWDMPLLDITKILEYDIKLIIIAANSYENEIYTSIKHMEKQGILIYKLSRLSKYRI